MSDETRSECDISAVAEIDRQMVALSRGVGALRLRLGEALEAFANRGGVAAFGFSSLAAYAGQRLGRSGHWAADARSLARRLAVLPRLRAALVAGELSTSMVEVLARFAMSQDDSALSGPTALREPAEHVTSLTEAALIAEARAPGVTVRSMRARLTSEPESGERADRSTVVAFVGAAEALAFERARLLIEAVGETRSRDEVVEAMLAEALGELMTAHPELPIPSGLGAEVHPAKATYRAALAEAERAAEVAAEARFSNAPVAREPGDDAEIELPEDPYALDTMMRAWATQLATRDLALAELASQMFGGRLVARLGYASFEQYVRERLGLSPSALKARLTLARRVGATPELGVALETGRIGFEAASLVARVARGPELAAWIARAETRTVKHLREEVDAATMMGRISGKHAVMGPPDEDTMEALRDVERSALESVVGQMSGGPMSGGPMPMDGAAGRVRLSMSLRDDVARLWRIVHDLHQKVAPDESFVWFLCAAVERAWRGAHAGNVAYQDVYLRDRFRCASPACSRRDVTPHHVVFRSRGGGEERSNLVSLCTVCHLELVHGRRLELTGQAPGRLTWRLGRDVVVVNGRRVAA